jgi:sigma-B regulation protein RsbU (phosphoserine phosphatase)
VADKGVPAALFMVMSRTLMRAVAFSGRAPAEALARVNQLIQSDSASDLFVTALYAQWQPEGNVLRFSNAGHNPPLFCRADGEVCVCRSKGVALGVIETIYLESHEIELGSGDVVLLYTDGLTDALNAAGQDFGMDRLSEVLAANRHKDAAGIVSALSQAVSDFAGDEPAFDDQTLVVIKRAELPGA